MRPNLEIRRQQLTLQAQFANPVFDLFTELPRLVQHLFRTFAGYNIRLADVKMDSAAESLGQVNLQMSWPDLATVRLFFERIDLTSVYPPFLGYRDGALVADLLDAVVGYSPEISYRAFVVTQEIHGALDLPSRDFLSRFSATPPTTLGPSLGSGTVFYFGAGENRLAGSLALDFSRVVEDGLFLKLVVIYDAAQVKPTEILTVSRSQLSALFNEIGLELVGG